MLGWFGRKPKIASGKIQLEDTPAAEDGWPASNAAKNAALSQAPLDRDLYSQALKAKGHISLKAVHDEYERLVWQKVRPDGSHDEKNDRSIVENISENEQGQDRPKISVNFSSWTIVRGELIRVYGFKNLSGPDTETKIELRCRLIFEGNKVRTFVHLLVKPHFVERSKSVASVFAPSDDLDGYKVLIARVEAAETDINFVTFDIGDGEHLVNVLKLGREITIKFAEFESNRLKYVLGHLALPNDATFSDRYDFFKASTILGVQFPSTLLDGKATPFPAAIPKTKKRIRGPVDTHIVPANSSVCLDRQSLAMDQSCHSIFGPSQIVGHCSSAALRSTVAPRRIGYPRRCADPGLIAAQCLNVFHPWSWHFSIRPAEYTWLLNAT